MKGRGFLGGFVLGVAGALLVLLIVGLTIVYTGSYNVAATAGHTAFVRWAFETTMHNSVESRAEERDAPEPAAISLAAGGAEYKAMCQHCHGGPGVEPAEWATGILPKPPDLTHAATKWQPHEIFWIVKHGIKMTGMPAFGPTHDDAALWNVAAFVNELPAMTPEDYRAYEAEGEGGHGHSHGEGETHVDTAS